LVHVVQETLVVVQDESRGIDCFFRCVGIIIIQQVVVQQEVVVVIVAKHCLPLGIQILSTVGLWFLLIWDL